MITDSKEYLELLYRISENNAPSIAVLAPAYEPFIEVDWGTRTIHAPDYISIKSDHRSETVFFKMDRYYDMIDLSTMCGIIQYVNAAGEGRIYRIPFYDLDTCSDENKILFPWVIEGEATKAAGEVKFSLRFFKLDTSGSYLLYNLNSLPATAKVLEGINLVYDEIYTEIELTQQTYRKGKYYILLKNNTYELATEDYDSSQTYYEKTTLNGDVTDYTATFLEEMVATAAEAASHDLTWVVL